MGWGDEIMVAGEAVRLGCDPGNPLVVLDGKGQIRSHPIWQRNKRIYRPGDPMPANAITVSNHTGWRPYVKYATARWQPKIANQIDDRTATNRDRWVFHPTWRATPGELPCVPRKRPERYIVVEPHVKAGGASTNKDWGWKRWQNLVESLTGAEIVQLGPKGSRALDGVSFVPTASFIEACSWLSGAMIAVLPEGGLHHAAAALGVPAVVLFGGSRSVFNTGYETHVNLDDPNPETRACGSRIPCRHCDEVWRMMTPEIVAETVMDLAGVTA